MTSMGQRSLQERKRKKKPTRMGILRKLGILNDDISLDKILLIVGSKFHT